MTAPRCIMVLSLLAQACMSTAPKPPAGPPPTDPIAQVSASDLRARGLAFARAGDLVRAEQYLQAAVIKGADDRTIVPELVRVCVTASRLRAAVAYGEPYLERHPQDAAMHFLLAIVHLSLGDSQRARAELEATLRYRPEAADADFYLGTIAADRLDFPTARRHFARYLAARPRGRHAARARLLLAQHAVRVMPTAEARP